MTAHAPGHRQGAERGGLEEAVVLVDQGQRGARSPQCARGVTHECIEDRERGEPFAHHTGPALLDREPECLLLEGPRLGPLSSRDQDECQAAGEFVSGQPEVQPRGLPERGMHDSFGFVVALGRPQRVCEQVLGTQPAGVVAHARERGGGTPRQILCALRAFGLLQGQRGEPDEREPHRLVVTRFEREAVRLLAGLERRDIVTESRLTSGSVDEQKCMLAGGRLCRERAAQ
jgi:hypothetical protein